MTEEEYSWVEKYRPETFDEIQGNTKACGQIKSWIRNWSEGTDPILLIGPPGVGKTTVAYVCSNYMDWPLTQVNASDKRTSDDIAEIASIARSKPVGAENQILLLDEVDSQSGNSNLDPLKRMLDDAPCPIIMTANDEYSIPSGIKRKATTHEFKLQKRSRQAKLKQIAEEEGLDLSTRDIARLADRPDLRSAINDLQMASKMDGEIGFDDREWDDTEFSATEDVLWDDEPVYFSFNLDPDDMLGYLDQNWRADASSNAKNIRGLEIAVAFDALSRSDKYLNRVWEGGEEFRYKKWASTLQEATAEVRKTERYGNWINLNYPEWRRHKQHSATDDSGEAKLFRKLSKFDEGGFTLGGNYAYFRRVLLPILKDLDDDERMQLALDSRATDDECLDALDIDSQQFDNWRGGEDWEETPMGGSALDW